MINENETEKINDYVEMTREEWDAEIFRIKQMKRKNGELYI